MPGQNPARRAAGLPGTRWQSGQLMTAGTSARDAVMITSGP